MYTLSNDFHDTRVTVRPANDGTMTSRQVRRARRELCGMSDCCCGGYLHERGYQPRGLEIVPRDDGGARILVHTEK